MKANEGNKFNAIFHKRMLAVPLLFGAAIVAAQPSTGLPPEYIIHNGTVAGGGGIQAVDCYTMVSTIGEAFVGRISTDIYTLTSGFPATIDLGDDRIFKGGFEQPSGICAP